MHELIRKDVRRLGSVCVAVASSMTKRVPRQPAPSRPGLACVQRSAEAYAYACWSAVPRTLDA